MEKSKSPNKSSSKFLLYGLEGQRIESTPVPSPQPHFLMPGSRERGGISASEPSSSSSTVRKVFCWITSVTSQPLCLDAVRAPLEAEGR